MIKNGKDTLLNQSTGTLPDLSGAMRDWFQKMTFAVITKTIVNFRAVEVEVRTAFQGVMQPASPEQIQLKPEGQRAWIWHTLHAETSLILEIDGKVIYLGLEYRVMSKSDFSKYGYVQYDLVEGFQP